MTKKTNSGHWKEFADAKGIDAKYAENQDQADRELKDALVTPRGDGIVDADDTSVKNPNGEFQHPAPMQGAAKGSAPAKSMEPEGHQGGNVQQWKSWAKDQ
jgi:hypothetical protein